MTLKATLRAAFRMTTEAGCTTGDKIIDEALLKGRYRVRLCIAWAEATQDISQLKVRTSHGRRVGEMSLAGLWRTHRLTPSAP